MSGLLEAARGGDEAAFHALVAPHCGPLYSHCHRMLACPHDAEDALQETMLRAWRALPKFEGRSAFGSWLYRIASNVCLTALEQRPKRGGFLEDELGEDAHDHLSIDADPNPTAAGYEQQEAATHALAATLHHLPANQRAALLLRDVLGFPAREAASALGTSVASLNSALQRARGNLAEGIRPARAGIGLDDAVEGFVGALARGDVETLVGIAADTTLSAERSWSYSPLPAY